MYAYDVYCSLNTGRFLPFLPSFLIEGGRDLSDPDYVKKWCGFYHSVAVGCESLTLYRTVVYTTTRRHAVESDNNIRLIEYDDLTPCEMCEEPVCNFHEVHFADCSCELKMWYEDNLRMAQSG